MNYKKIKFNLKMVLGTSVFFCVANAQTVVPQVVVNQNPVIAGTQVPDPWAEEVLNTFVLKSDLALHSEAQVTLTEAVALWQQSFGYLMSHANNLESRQTLIYRVANRTLEMAGQLQALATEEIDSGIPDYAIGIGRANGPTIALYNHAYEVVKKIMGADDRSYFWAIRNYQHADAIPHEVDLMALDRSLRQYAKETLRWFQAQFIVVGTEDETARYSNKVYYSMLSSILKGLANDLSGDADPANPNLFPVAHASLVKKMRSFAEVVDSYQSGNASTGNSSSTFYFVNQQFKKLINSF